MKKTEWVHARMLCKGPTSCSTMLCIGQDLATASTVPIILDH